MLKDRIKKDRARKDRRGKKKGRKAAGNGRAKQPAKVTPPTTPDQATHEDGGAE